MEVLSFWFSFSGHNPFKVEHWYHYRRKMFPSHFLSPIHFCGDETSKRRLINERKYYSICWTFIFQAHFRPQNRSAKFLFYIFNFIFFLVQTPFCRRKTSDKVEQQLISAIYVSFVFLQSSFSIFLFSFFVLLSHLYVFYVHFLFVQFPFVRFLYFWFRLIFVGGKLQTK